MNKLKTARNLAIFGMSFRLMAFNQGPETASEFVKVVAVFGFFIAALAVMNIFADN